MVEKALLNSFPPTISPVLHTNTPFFCPVRFFYRAGSQVPYNHLCGSQDAPKASTTQEETRGYCWSKTNETMHRCVSKHPNSLMHHARSPGGGGGGLTHKAMHGAWIMHQLEVNFYYNLQVRKWRRRSNFKPYLASIPLPHEVVILSPSHFPDRQLNYFVRTQGARKDTEFKALPKFSLTSEPLTDAAWKLFEFLL